MGEYSRLSQSFYFLHARKKKRVKMCCFCGSFFFVTWGKTINQRQHHHLATLISQCSTKFISLNVLFYRWMDGWILRSDKNPTDGKPTAFSVQPDSFASNGSSHSRKSQVVVANSLWQVWDDNSSSNRNMELVVVYHYFGTSKRTISWSKYVVGSR